MDRKKRIWLVCLIVLFVALFVFIIRMQHQFVNGSYAAVQTNDTRVQSEEIEDEEIEEVEMKENDEEEIEEEASSLPDVMYVTADQLNIRSGPGADYPIEGIVYMHEEVEIEEQEDDWVKINYNDVTGYVSIDYLTEEIEEN